MGLPFVFERPVTPGWVYPCTAEELGQQLSTFPPEDLEGLHAVGLVPATRKNCRADARYFPGARPEIHVYSQLETLSWKQPPHVRRAEIETGLAVEIDCGLRVEQVGRRWSCTWAPDAWRRFVLEHVLAHEIGHHLYHQRRLRAGLAECPGNRVCEQHAEAYARRYRELPSRLAGQPLPNTPLP